MFIFSTQPNQSCRLAASLENLRLLRVIQMNFSSIPILQFEVARYSQSFHWLSSLGGWVFEAMENISMKRYEIPPPLIHRAENWNNMNVLISKSLQNDAAFYIKFFRCYRLCPVFVYRSAGRAYLKFDPSPASAIQEPPLTSFFISSQTYRQELSVCWFYTWTGPVSRWGVASVKPDTQHTRRQERERETTWR